jgi:hypothetical protein
MVGQALTAGTLTPTEATATYVWQRCAAAEGSYQNISGAVYSSYTLTSGDLGYYIKVVATGSGAYYGTVTSAAKGPVSAAAITGIGPVSGTTTVGETLTAGALTPPGATAGYQWKRCETIGGTYEDISGATSATYTLVSLDTGYYIRVTATGTGAYTGTATSTATGPVTESATPLTGIGEIAGTARVGGTLTAGDLTPEGATATWQWARCATVDGTYQNISGATSASYTLTAGDFEYYIKVKATGSGVYSGTVTSPATAQVAAGIITGITDIVGTSTVGQNLYAGTISPSGATVTYQWQYFNPGSMSEYENIPDATLYTYHIQDQEYVPCYLRVVVTGTGSYTGTATSNPTGPVTASATPITAIGAISGTTQVGQTLTAGALTPSGATATYQWQWCETSDGSYENISGAISGTYTVAAGYLDKYIKVTATGSGTYSGTVTSAAAGPVTAAAITGIGTTGGTTTVGQTLTAGALTPSGATASYKWQRCETVDGTYSDISGAVSDSYVLVSGDTGYYIRVVATGTGGYTGTATSVATGPVTGSSTPLSGIGAITGTAQVGETLTAGALTPEGATATYTWWRCDTVDGTYQQISGATSGSYTLTATDFGKYIKVKATGSGSYSGAVTSAATAQVAGAAVTGIGDIIGDPKVGSTVTAGAVTPSGATVEYQWQHSDWNGENWADIDGATSGSYYLQWGTYSGNYLRVAVTGTGAYTGTVYSNPTSVRVHF